VALGSGSSSVRNRQVIGSSPIVGSSLSNYFHHATPATRPTCAGFVRIQEDPPQELARSATRSRGRHGSTSPCRPVVATLGCVRSNASRRSFKASGLLGVGARQMERPRDLAAGPRCGCRGSRVVPLHACREGREAYPAIPGEGTRFRGWHRRAV